MSEIQELGQRITAAMDRIARGVESAGAGSATEAEAVAELTQSLEDERLANAQLEERLKSIKEKNDKRLAELEAAGADLRNSMASLDDQLQRLRKANEQLRSNNEALRGANEEGVTEPHLINKAMLAELESLRASRATDMAEASAILGAMAPLLDGADAYEEDN